MSSLWLCAAHAGPAASAPLPGAPELPAGLRTRIASELAARGPDYVPRTRHLDAEGAPLYSNRLLLETSPYLRQHAHNPVNWFPWGEEAFAFARASNRPILLSVGYSTCHWCHVMEEESFEDPEIAAYLNEFYVAVKVDREERPDVDGVYMTAVQLLSGRGGWPMTVWLTPELEPFYGGTYFPPRGGDRRGHVGFLTLLRRLRTAFDESPGEIASAAKRVGHALRESMATAESVGFPGRAELDRAFARYRSEYDAENGGVRSQMKFPSSLPIGFLLRAHRRSGDPEPLEMARTTLDAMRRGGIYDHVGGGFHRYATEPTWTVPHFEKMLYDNALLVLDFVEAYQVSGERAYLDVAVDVLEYVAREMTSPEGTFYAATDADSEGEEGAYFVWTPQQVRSAVGPERADLALAAYAVTEEGNFDGGRTVLRRDRGVRELSVRTGMAPSQVPGELAQIRRDLLAARKARVPPLRDEKQLVGWNALMIQAFVRGGLARGRADLVDRGARAGAALLERARPHGRVARYLYAGAPHGEGVLEDHAFLVAALIDLFEATGEPVWLEGAISVQASLDGDFFDAGSGGYFQSREGDDALLVRAKSADDQALPSGNSVAALDLQRLYYLTGDAAYQERAEMTLRAFSDGLRERPTAHGRMLDALDFFLDTPKEILIVTPGSRAQAEPFLRELASGFVPNRVLVVAPEWQVERLAERVPLLAHKRAIGGEVTAYVCEDRVCDLPAKSPAVFAQQIRRSRVSRR